MYLLLFRPSRCFGLSVFLLSFWLIGVISGSNNFKYLSQCLSLSKPNLGGRGRCYFNSGKRQHFLQIVEPLCLFFISTQPVNSVGDMTDRSIERISKCRCFGLLVFWIVSVLGCRCFGLSVFWVVGVLGCRCFGSVGVSAVGVLGCRCFGCRCYVRIPIEHDAQ